MRLSVTEVFDIEFTGDKPTVHENFPVKITV